MVPGMQGVAYDFRSVPAARAGSWLQEAMAAFEVRTGRKPERFVVARPNLLLLD